jgi:hypothetical protein
MVSLAQNSRSGMRAVSLRCCHCRSTALPTPGLTSTSSRIRSGPTPDLILPVAAVAGLTTPGPYFRAKLCALFGTSAEVLDLLNSSPRAVEMEAEVTEQISSSSAGIPAVWNVPYLRNPRFTGREKLIELLGQQFALGEDATVTGLHCAALTKRGPSKDQGDWQDPDRR